MEIGLSFSIDEMKFYLEERGYTIQTVGTWENENAYHNKVETVDKICTIATKETVVDITDNNHHRMESKWGIQSVFTKELHRNLLKLKL